MSEEPKPKPKKIDTSDKAFAIVTPPKYKHGKRYRWYRDHFAGLDHDDMADYTGDSYWPGD